jgi:Ca2+-binding RTX toxin-like protein
VLGAHDDQVKLASGLTGWAVDGGNGTDNISGNGGSDSLSGGPGDDTVRGLGGDDVLYNGPTKPGAGPVDHDLIEGGAGADLLVGSQGGATLDGGAGADTIRGGYYGDTLIGSGGDDLLQGGGGYTAQLMQGGDGADTLQGSYAGDTLQGGAGHDVYRYGQIAESFRTAPDIIQDADGDFVVDLSPITPDIRYQHREDPFTVVDAFDGGRGELTIRYDASDGITHVEGDVNRDMKADLVILVQGDHTDLSQYVL